MLQRCHICNDTKLYKRLGSHLAACHDYRYEDYVKLYQYNYTTTCINIYCHYCGNVVKFNGRTFHTFCSNSCAAKYRYNLYNYNTQVLKFEQLYNCTSADKLRKQYGQGWYKAGVISSNDFIKAKLHNIAYFVKNSDVYKIIEYTNSKTKSITQQHIYEYIKTNCNDITILQNCKNVLKEYELDIYIPFLKLAIEYNGTYWHSIEKGIPKDYHLNKSIMCRQHNIRLIHIYEFEDLQTQLSMIVRLIKDNIDLYNENDFNKNNLTALIPLKPVVVHKGRYTLYGAGELL